MHIVSTFDKFAASKFWQGGKWLLLAAIVGGAAGLGAIAFHSLTQLVAYYGLVQFAGYEAHGAIGEHKFFVNESVGVFHPWRLIVIATLGGLASGLLVYLLAPEAEGHGTDAVIDAFHNRRGVIRPRIPLVKIFASAITLGTGGSGGREGPIAQIGAGFGSVLASWLGLSTRERRILLVSGMGAGVGAIFRAPLAGAIFAAEILYADAEFESDVVVPAAGTSIMAYVVYTLSLPSSVRYVPLFGRDLQHHMDSSLELLAYGVLSLFLVAAAILFIIALYGTHDLFKRLPIIRHLRPAVGACLAASIGVGLWWMFDGDTRVLAVLADGYGTLQLALTSTAELGIPLLATVAAAKILTTSLTIGSGGSGGVFGPSMVIGGCTGAAVGKAFHSVWPSVVHTPESFTLVGMAGFFAGAAHAPISTVVMVSEMTGNYGLLPPTMLCSTLCFVLCRRWKLYHMQVASRLDSPAHKGDFIIDLLEGIGVAEVYRQLDERTILVPESTSLDEIVHRLTESDQQYFPVVDDLGKLVGVFSTRDVQRYLYDESLWKLANANDIMTSKVISVTPEDDLNSALRKFAACNLEELPVVDTADASHLIGMLRRKETIAFYMRRLVSLKQAPEGQA